MKKTALAVAGVSGKVYFSDTFDNMDKWVSSNWKGANEIEEFKIKARTRSLDAKDTAMTSTEDARFYAASAQFDSFSNEGKTLIVQYQALYEKDIECGGGYIKIGPKMEDQTKFGDPTKYYIMFGPDKCGYSKRTHLIFSKGDKTVLKKVDLPYKQEKDGVSNLYRLTLNPDSTVKVDIDGEEVYSGSMETDWDLLEPKEIADPDEKKPKEWVDEPMMDDPEDKKPDDWVEIKEIADTKAKQPEDWDAEEDGEWEAPMIANPDFKGEWSAKRISNPDYKGMWEAKKIANPAYVADDALYKFADFGFVGFDLWQVKAGSFFDNLLITDDLAEADKMMEQWKALSEHEKAELEKEAATKKEEKTEEKDDEMAEDKDDDEEDL